MNSQDEWLTPREAAPQTDLDAITDYECDRCTLKEAAELYGALSAENSRLHLPVPPAFTKSSSTFMNLPVKIVSKSICPYLTIPDIWRLSAVNSHARVLLRHLPEILSVSDYDYVNSVSAGDVTVKGTRVWYKEQQADSERDDRSSVDLGHHLCVKQAVRGGVPANLRNRLYLHLISTSTDFQRNVIAEIWTKSKHDTATFSVLYEPPIGQSEPFSGECLFAAKLAGLIEEALSTDLFEHSSSSSVFLTSSDRQILKLALEAAKNVAAHHDSMTDSIFEFMRTQGNSSLSLEDLIDRDLDRTFPSHPLFKVNSTGKIIKQAMREILVAIALLEPSLGYCQGMNFVAGALVIELMCPETAFWTMLFLLRRRTLIGLFSPGVSAMSTKLMQLKEIIRLHTPDTYISYKRAGISLELLCHQSLITSLTYFLHPSIVIHFWDAVMLGGSKVLLVVTLSVLCLLEKKALRNRGDSPVRSPREEKQLINRAENSGDAKDNVENQNPQASNSPPRFQSNKMLDEPLQLVQEERLRISHLYKSSEAGEEQFQELVTLFLKYFSKCTSQFLSRLSSISLVTMIREMVVELHNAMKQSASSVKSSYIESRDPKSSRGTDGSKAEGKILTDLPLLDEGLISPPYLLVPKLPQFCGDIDDTQTPRGMLVHFIASAESAKSFKFSLQKPRVTEAEDDLPPAPIERHSSPNMYTEPGGRLTWSLLIPEQERVNASELRLVHGGGRLKATSFYVILDARYYLNEERVPILCSDDICGEERDALAEYLLRKKMRLPQIDNIAQIPLQELNGYLRDVDVATAQGTASMRRLGHNQSDHLIAVKTEANQLLDWLKEHDVSPMAHVGSTILPTSNCEQEGFIIIPLKVLITLIHAFREKRKQFVRDREHFEIKVASLDRLINQLIRQIDRMRQRHSQQIKVVSQLEQDLYEHLTRTPKAGRPTVWKKLLTWKTGSRRPIPKFDKSVIVHSPTQESAAESNANADDGGESPTDNQDEALTERPRTTAPIEISPVFSVCKTDWGMEPLSIRQRPQTTMGRTYEKQKNKLEELADKLAACEESLTEQISIKSTLSQTYHEIETVQLLEELEVVESMLLNCCSWRKGSSLPLPVLMQAGIIHEDDPTLSGPQISLPPIIPQLESIFKL